MVSRSDLILGEFPRTLDERFRVSLPGDLVELLTADREVLTLAKERPGCLSLWNSAHWQQKLDDGVDVVCQKIKAGRLDADVAKLQQFGRLLSTRHVQLQLAGRGRLTIHERFRQFLGVEPGDEVMVVGAAVCVEIWHPQRWSDYLQQRMSGFRELFEELM